LSKYLSNQKLWRITKERDTYYYEIRLAGTTIDRLPIEYPVLKYLKKEGVINDHRSHASNLS
jgi:hypothetical protein